MSVPPSGSLPPIDQALLPASVRSGSPAARQAYDAGLGFEQMLVQQLSQELSATASGSSSDGSSSDGSGDGSSGSGAGIMGSDPASSMYSQLLPQALSSSVMSAGGLGVAQELASALDPALGSRP